MDFLDPQKQKQHSRRLAIGYALIAIVLFLSTIILLYLAYGYDIDRSGKLFQNGLVFISSRPDNAKIVVNGVAQKSTTNTRLALPAGQYTVQLQKEGYRTWQRAITSEGGVVQRFDYPILFPTTLVTNTTKQYTAAPTLGTESPDRHWLVVATGDDFDLYDSSSDKPFAKPLQLPTDIYTAATTTTGWQPITWADDNRHVILLRTFQKNGQAGSEYILFDRQEPAQSQNLSILWGFTPSTVQLKDGNYDDYYLYNQATQQLFTSTLKKPTPVPLLEKVLAFSAFQDQLLYATSADAPAGKVMIRLQQGNTTDTLRQAPAGTTYMLNLAKYNDNLFVAAGTSSENKVPIYKNPQAVLGHDAKAVVAPIYVLKVTDPKTVLFTPNGRFALVENGSNFATFDGETTKGYAYQVKTPLDAPQQHATWMDDFHLSYIGAGAVVVLDFDGTNAQILSPSAPAFQGFFSRNYQQLYTITTQNALSSTELLVQ